MPLTDVAVRTAKPGEKPIKLADEKGMFLFVTPAGAKLWRLKYRFDGKEKLLALGAYPEISLKDARQRRDDARKLLADAKDPGEERKAQRVAKVIAAGNSFETIAKLWHSKVSVEMVPNYAEKVIRSLEKDVFPSLGKRPINDIRPPEVLAMLRKIESRGALETLKRVRQRCADVFTFAIASGLRETENPLVGLEKTLKIAKVQHRPSLPARKLPEFFIRLDAVRISLPVKYALHLVVLTFLRPGELRGARWQEIDLDSGTWIVPAERDRQRGLVGMKMKEAHVVPLSKQAVAIFRELQTYSGDSDLVFPNRNDPLRPISDGTINSALRAMGYSVGEVSGHGFRATAASALAELGFRKEVIDRQLSHRERNQVLAAYVHQAEYVEERRKMMQHWADYVDQLNGGANVIALHSKTA